MKICLWNDGNSAIEIKALFFFLCCPPLRPMLFWTPGCWKKCFKRARSAISPIIRALQPCSCIRDPWPARCPEALQLVGLLFCELFFHYKGKMERSGHSIKMLLSVILKTQAVFWMTGTWKEKYKGWFILTLTCWNRNMNGIVSSTFWLPSFVIVIFWSHSLFDSHIQTMYTAISLPLHPAS